MQNVQKKKFTLLYVKQSSERLEINESVGIKTNFGSCLTN